MRVNVNRRDGDYAFHSNHLVNGATGSHGDDPDAVTTVHATGTHLDPDPDTGVIAPAASSQNGRDWHGRRREQRRRSARPPSRAAA